MKILVCCGGGVGSSFMIQLNIEKVLKELKIDAEVDHTDLSSAASMKSDIYVATRDIANHLNGLGGEVISLNNMIDKKELVDKLTQTFKKIGVM